MLPTRNSSTLDWFAINNISLVLDSGVLPPLNNLDHSLIFTTLNCLLTNSPPSSKLLWDYANADFTNLNDALLCVPWEDIVANSPNVHLALANITDIINQCARQYIPTKKSNLTQCTYSIKQTLVVLKVETFNSQKTTFIYQMAQNTQPSL